MKEKIDREIRVKLPASLFDKLQQKCDKEYKTLSEVIRDLVRRYIDINIAT